MTTLKWMALQMVKVKRTPSKSRPMFATYKMSVSKCIVVPSISFSRSGSFFLANFALFRFSIALSLIFSLPLIFSATLSLSLSSAT